MPDNKNHKEWLYNTMKDEGVEVPSYDVFNTDMDDENIRKWYYDKLGELGYDAKSREEFDSAMGYAPATKSEQTRVKKMEQPYVQAQSGAGTYTPGANVKLPTAKETLHENRNYKPKATAPKASSTKAPAPKVSTAKAAEPKAEEEQQRPGFMPIGMSSFGTSTPQNMVEQGQSGYQPTTLREASDAIVANDADDAVSKAWDMAEQRTMEAQSIANRDYVSGSAIVPGQEAMGTSLSAMDASNRAIRMSEHDIERMAEDAWNAIPEEQKNAMYEGIRQEILSRYPKARKEDINESAIGYARAMVNQKMWEKAVEMNAPKTATDYFFRKVVGANAVRKIEEGLSRSIMGTTGDMYAREVAEQRFEQSGHKVAGVAGTVVGMAVDPMMWIAGGVGSAATNGSMWLGGKIVGETAARRAATTFAGKVATRAVGGAANFAAFEGMGEALDQYQHGGVAAEQGPHMKKIGAVEYLPTDSWHPQSSGEYSVGDILGKMGHGAVMGGTIGVIGGIIGNVSENAVHATNTLIANDGVRAAAKSGIRAGELGVSTVAEGTIFAVPDMAGVAREYNKQIASLSDKSSENYIADDEERAAAIERLERKRKEAVMDVWDDSMVMMLGFKAQGAIKSAPKRIAELAARGDGRRGFVERLNRALDGSAPELALTKDEEAELDAAGYTDLKELTKDYKDFEGAKGVRVDAETGAEVEGELPYNRFTELMQDGRVSEAARAKMYYYLSGKQLPMSTVMGSNIIENTDENGRVSYTVQSFGANGIITSKTYTSKSRAEADVANINRQAELNSLYIGERYYDNMADKKDMYEACKTIGEEKGVVADMLYDLMQKDPADMSEVERELAEEILGEYYATRGNNTSETLRNGRYAGIDGIIRKPANKRSEREQQFLKDYLADLYADAKRESMGEDPISDNGESADFKNGYNATPQEAKDIYVGLSLAEREPLAQAKLQEEYRGVMKRIADECDYLAAMERKNMEKLQHKDDKGLHEVVLNRHADSEEGDVAYIVNGSCEQNAQGEWVGDKSVVVYDPATGELKQMFPATDFKELGHVTSAEEVENGIMQGRKRNYENRVAEVTNRVELEPGDRFAMPDGQNAQVIGVDGDNITVLLGDGTQTSISQAELQRQNDEAAMAYYRERFGEPTEAGKSKNGIVEGAPASYEPGMSIIVKDDDGNEQNGVVVGRSRSEGMANYVEDPNGPFVTYVLANGLEYHDTPADLEKKVSGYVVENEGGEELTAKPASEAGHGGEGGEEPIAEGAPIAEGKPIAEGEPVASGPAEPIADAPAAGETPEVRMEGAMPIGDDGNPMWLASAPADGHEYLYKNSGLERDEANEFVAAKIAEAEKAAKAIEKKKPKVSTDLAKYKAEKEAWQNDMDAAQGAVDYWKDVKGVEDVIEAEAAARIEEEQRAAEEAKAAEEAEKARVEAERVKAEEEAKAKAEAERVEAERKAAEEAKREKELAEKAAVEAEAARVKAEEEARAEAERKAAEEKARLQAKPAMEAGHGEVDGKKGAEVEEGPKSAFDVEESGIPANVRNRQEMLDNAVRAYNDVLKWTKANEEVTFDAFAKQYEENNGSVIAKYDKPYLQGLFDYVSGKLEKLADEREKNEKEPKWFEINRNQGYEDIEMEVEAIIAKEKDERNSAIQHIRNTYSGKAMERKLIQKASELYGEYFVYDTDMPNDVMELASLFILGKNSKIAWHDTDSGKRGFAKDLGMRFGKGGDLNESFTPYIAKKGEGRSIDEVVTSIYNSVENWPMGSEYPRFQDDEIRDAVIEMFMIAQTPNDIKYYMLNNAIERAEDTISNLNERYAVQYAIAEAKEKEEARILSEFVLENAKAISSMREEEFTEFLIGTGSAYEEWLEEQAKALAELTDEQYNNIKDDRRTNQTDEGRGTEKSASRGSEKEPSQGSNSTHDTRRNDSLEEGARSEVRNPLDPAIGTEVAEHLNKMGIDTTVDVMEYQHQYQIAKRDKSEAGKPTFFTNKQGKRYGFVRNGKIYLDPRHMEADMPIHEYSHLWCKALELNNPKEWENIIGILKGDETTWNAVKEIVGEGSDSDVASELISKFSGERGSARINEEIERMRRNAPDAKASVLLGNALKNIKKAIQDFWKAVSSFLNIKYTSAEQVYDQVLADFASGVNPIKAIKDYIGKVDKEYESAVINGDAKRAAEIFNDALAETIGNGSVPFISVDRYRKVQSLAHAVKSGDKESIRRAAELMAPLVPKNAVLIPMVSHTGKATDMLALSNAIADIAGCDVADILESGSRDSQYESKKQGRVIPSSELGIRVKEGASAPEGKIAVVVDNVVGTGNTAKAAIDALGKGVVLSLGAANNGDFKSIAELKSANPIEFSKDGKLIPLSERFNVLNVPNRKVSYKLNEGDVPSASDSIDLEHRAQDELEEALRKEGVPDGIELFNPKNQYGYDNHARYVKTDDDRYGYRIAIRVNPGEDKPAPLMITISCRGLRYMQKFAETYGYTFYKGTKYAEPILNMPVEHGKLEEKINEAKSAIDGSWRKKVKNTEKETKVEPTKEETLEKVQSENYVAYLNNLERMSDEELLGIIRQQGKDQSKAGMPEAYDVYDDRHQDDYNEGYEMMLGTPTSIDDAYDALERIEGIYANGGYHSEVRSVLVGQMDALREFIDAQERVEEEGREEDKEMRLGANGEQLSMFGGAKQQSLFEGDNRVATRGTSKRIRKNVAAKDGGKQTSLFGVEKDAAKYPIRNNIENGSALGKSIGKFKSANDYEDNYGNEYTIANFEDGYGVWKSFSVDNNHCEVNQMFDLNFRPTTEAELHMLNDISTEKKENILQKNTHINSRGVRVMNYDGIIEHFDVGERDETYKTDDAQLSLFADDSAEMTLFGDIVRKEGVQVELFKAEDGDVVGYASMLPKEKNAKDGDLAKMRLRKLEEGEFCNTERYYIENGFYNFTKRGPKVGTYEDIAYMFKNLEDSAIEHVFAVLLKGGKPTIVHIGTGGFTQSTVDFRTVLPAVNHIDPDAIFLVHNHPSGNLAPSKPDIALFDKMKKMWGDKVKNAVIIDTYSGEFGTFNESEINRLEELKGEGGIPLKVYSFGKQAFYDKSEQTIARNAMDVAKYISTYRLGVKDKLAAVILDGKNNVVGNIHLSYGKIKGNEREIANELSTMVSQMGGIATILYGTKLNLKDVAKVRDICEVSGTHLLDAILLGHQIYDFPLDYRSALEESAMEPGVDYSAKRGESKPITERDVAKIKSSFGGDWIHGMLERRNGEGLGLGEKENLDSSRLDIRAGEEGRVLERDGRDVEEGGIRFRDGEDAPVFVSNAARALEGIKQEKATPEQWLAMLTKAGGIKAGEDKWMGLSDWLKERAKDGAKSLTKDEVARYIAENAIGIYDVNYSENGIPTNVLDLDKREDIRYAMDTLNDRFDELMREAYEMGDLTEEDYDDVYQTKAVEYAKNSIFDPDEWNTDDLDDTFVFNAYGIKLRTQADPKNVFEYLELDVPNDDEINSTRLSYTTEGLDNKKEIALVVPTIESYNKSDDIHFGDAGNGRAVAWARFGETTDADGNRVLVIDEVQSKRHQDGREKGYGELTISEFTEYGGSHISYADVNSTSSGPVGKIMLRNGKYIPLNEDSSFMMSSNSEYNTKEEALQRIKERRFGKYGVPDAPFDKNWHELAMKRMLRYAAENGYDKVAWTKGEQQADRYDQRKHIDYINCGANDSRGFTGAISVGIIGSGNIMTDQSGKVIYADSAFSQSVGKPLSDTFGKEIAEQIMSMKSGETLKGDDLFIGGEGMKGFYDKMLPAFMNKYCKKWGTQVGEVTLPNVEEAGRTMWAVDVTQEMRESVMTEPQPMFRGDGEDTVVEKDKETLKALDKEPVEYGYRNVEMREEMDMLSPMGAKLKGNGKEAVANIPFSFLEYERSVEHPELVDENGKIDLVKANGKPLSKVDYNPYIHIRPTKVNYQFAEAWNRPGLIFIKTAYPKSELESGYQADKAKLAVGRHDWNGGELILSRWDKPVGIVPWSEIADDWMAQYGEKGVPFNRLHPMLVPILESRGMKILPPDGNVGAACKEAYESWRENGTLNTKGAIDDARIGEINKMLENRMSNEPRTMRDAASEYATKLNANVNIIEDAEGLTGRKAKAKGWYDMSTGEVNVVIGNHKDVGDVIATISHEVIGHKGLRELVGDEGYDTFLDEVYDHLEDALKERVDERWAREHVRRPETSHEQKRREAVDELIAEMAEKPFEEFSEGERTLWQKIKRKVRELLDKLLGGGKLPGWFKIGDNEIRYMLWRSKEKMERGKEGPIDVARDIVKREELGLDFKDGEDDDTDPDGPGNGGGRPMTAARKGAETMDENGVISSIKDIAGAKSYRNNSAYVSGETEDGETYTIRISDHAANESNFSNHDEDSDYKLSIVVSSDFDKNRQRQEPMTNERSGRLQVVIRPEDYDESFMKFAIDRFKKSGSFDYIPDDIRYRDGEEEELKDIMKDGSMGMAEKLTAAKLLIVERNREDAEARRNALRSLGGNLADIRRATGLQKQFDKTTVKRVADLARVMVSSGLFNDIQRGEMRRLLSIVKNSAGKDDLSSAVNTMYDMMLNNNLNTMRGALDKLTKIKAGKVDAKGVEVQGKLDVNGQIMLKAYKKGVGLSSAELEDKIADAMNRMASEDDSLAEEASMEYMGLTIARDFVEGARECLEEIDDIKDMMRHARRDTTEQREYYESLVDAERDAKIDLIESYANVIAKLGESMKESIEKAKAFVEEDKANAMEIQHYANSDMKGKNKREHYQSTTMSKIANGAAARALLSPLSTFDQMLRLFGSKSANGEGYLYNHFMRGVVEARTREIKGYREKCAILDDKVRELFGGKVKNLSDLISHIGKMPKMDVMFMDGGSMEPHKLNQGNLMYIYMVDKMSDGRMKLRKMGITSESVEDITNELNPKLRIMADWIQEEFLVDTRNEYNKTHKALFGAPMASIENYFPIKINSGSRTEKADNLDKQGENQSISTTTGSIIKRRRNNLALDLLNANAIEVLVDHIAKMEHWNAYASFNRDLNVLRTFKSFENKVRNMNTVYGSGQELWDNFNRVCRMAAGTYDPSGKNATFDKAIVNINRNVAAAKVSFRLWTAIKQLSSIPAFFANARADYMAEGMIAPWKAWEWAMDNLPIFEERWKSRMSGDPRLMKSNKDWKSGRANAVQVASRIGMSPNAFMDALAVSIGSYAIYKTKFGQYKREGFTEEYADKRAKQDAVVAFNQSQQSNEGPFTAPVQVDRTVAASTFTLFRNASMGYQRQAHDALRNTVKTLTPGYRGQSIAFMTKQLVKEGLSEEQAKKAATKRYARQVFKNPLNLAIFGWLLPYLWDLMAYAPYLIFGDDDKKKSEMKEDAWQHSKFGWLEGLAGGDVISEGGKMLLMDDINADYLRKELPLTSDLHKMLQNVQNKKYQAVVNDIMNIIVQIGIGVNPQSATDIALAIMDACGNDVELAHEATIMIARIAQVPQSQIEGLYFDEVGLSGDEVSKYTPAELAKRYAEYKVKRGAIYSPWTWEDEDAIEKKEKTSKSLIKERVERLGEKDINDKYLEYEEVYKELAEIQKEAKKWESKDFVRFAQAMDQLKSDKNKYDIYMRFKELDKTLNKLVERYMKAQSGEEAAKLHEQIIEYKADMVKKLEEGNN